jgi:hypothetical protein
VPSMLYRSLTTLLILFGSISLANAQSGVTEQSTTNTGTSGWTWLQDSPLIFCSPGPVTSCNVQTGNLVPTTAGSVWVVQIQTTNNVTITSVTGGGGTWVHCPNCHVTNPSGLNADASYNLSGNAGTSQGITITLSGSSGSIFGANFYELLPPPGSTASFDDSGISAPTGCTVCSGVTLTHITGTDAIITNPGGPGQHVWNAWSAPYFMDSNGAGIALNVTSGAAPTLAFQAAHNPEFMAIAFTSSKGIFTPPTHQYSIVNVTASGSLNCSPTCSITVPSTGSNHLLFLESADEAFTHITSVSGGGSWVVPTGANTCQIQFAISSQNNANSCAYVLSSTSGTKSISVTMSGSASTAFLFWEIATTTGSFVLDAHGSAINNTTSFFNNGPTLTLTGSNDVIFETEWCVGGSLGPNLYPQPFIAGNANGAGPFNYFLFNEASMVVLLDSAPVQAAMNLGSQAPTPTWLNPQHNPTFVSGVAFSTVGASASPNPPTGLTAIVH